MSDFWAWAATEGRAIGLSLIAGAAGGIVRTAALGQRGWTAFAGNVVVGAICAAFLGPFIQPLLEPIFGSVAPTAGVSGFVAGLCGMTISGAIIDIAARQFDRRNHGSGSGKE